MQPDVLPCEPQVHQEKVNILLVDDHPENLLTLEAILADLGENLVKAHSGQEALRCLLEQDFAVILLDVQMPELDGFETATLIRKRPRSRQTPIIFVTAFSTSNNLVFKGYSLGAVDYLLKPLEPAILRSKVNVFVDLYRKTAALERQARQLEMTQRELQVANSQLNHLNADLEQRVLQRTAQLEATNRSLESEIRDRKQAELALQESEKRLRLATMAANLGMWFWDLATGEIVFTPRGLDLFGVQGQTSMTYPEFVAKLHPGDRDRIQGVVAEVLRSRQEYNEEYRVLEPDGQIRWIAARGRGLYNAEGQAVQMMGVVLDITKRKATEAALRQSDERFRQFADNIQDVFWIFELAEDQKRLLYVSPAYEQIWGRSLSALYDDYHEWLDAIHPDDRDRVMLFLCENMVRDEFSVEYRVIRPDGSIRWVRDRGFPVRDAQSGEVVRVTGITEDITDRKQSEAEREQLLASEQAARAEAEAASRIKDEFLAILSHELRSPLNPILGWAKLLRSRKLDEATTHRALETIERNVKLQAQLIEDLLDVSRILRGKLVLNQTHVTLPSTIEAAIETVQLSADAKSISIVSDLDTTLGPVLGDPNRLQQVIWNLLSNAVKFSPDGSTVTIRLRRVDEDPVPPDQAVIGMWPTQSMGDRLPYAKIEVIDTGRGIKPDFLPYVFERFRQADSTTTRVFGGLGLGLAIVRYLIEMHGGAVWVESQGEGHGATFTVLLPLLSATSEAALEPPDASLVLDLSGIRVLLVDDEEDTREVVACTLTQYGAQVTIAQSAREVLTILDRDPPPHILLSDIGMPEMDGYTLLRSLRSRTDDLAQLPAIALTAYASEADTQRTRDVGFQQHIAKPVEPLSVIRAILQLVQST
ncbi:response regulator [Geitlerinema sp. PCC 7407]|uniref:hybrid sensor histidine kinase/response regulator n=1 Tax=Geitlerinema sp. PCC 7407 TaxID=1173025 RepID=UPI00029FD23D|nr:response regulator [Geitlerinema sp. PCC 7407]AFY66498.1 multi-sensor hybrid histidine kinase [Geitlerinema sp. PCC 7407]